MTKYKVTIELNDGTSKEEIYEGNFVDCLRHIDLDYPSHCSVIIKEVK